MLRVEVVSEPSQLRLGEPDEAGRARQRSLDRKRLLHALLPLFLGSVIAYLDRVNLAYAALTMNEDLGFRRFPAGRACAWVGCS